MEDIEMIDSSGKGDSTFWKKLYLDTFKRKYLVGCSDLFIKGLRVIDGDFVQETVKIDDDKSQDLNNYSEFPLDWIVTKNFEHKSTNSKLKDQFEYEFDKLMKLIDQESINEELEAKLSLQVKQNTERDLDSKIGCVSATTKKLL